ncbi:cyclic nucleotide-binding domain-containing protein [bacterium]|nr:cyclic nucleotide-binding domain-containing protein [bacterium]
MKREIKRGAFLCLQGEKADCFFILLKGKLEVKCVPNSKNLVTFVDAFAAKTVNFIEQPGLLFGEIATILDSTRQASLLAIEDTEVMVIPLRDHNSYKTALAIDPRFGLNLGNSIALQVQGMKKVLQKLLEADSEMAADITDLKETFQKLIDFTNRIPRFGNRMLWHKDISMSLKNEPFLTRKTISKLPASFYPPGCKKYTRFFEKFKLSSSTYYPDTVLFRQGEFDDFVYVLLSGHLEVRVNGVVVDDIKDSGTLIGEDELFLNIGAGSNAVKQPADVICTTISDAIKITTDEFKKIFSGSNEFSYEFIRVMANRLVARNNFLFETEKRIVAGFNEKIYDAFQAFEKVKKITEKSTKEDPELKIALNLANQGVARASEKMTVWHNWFIANDIFVEGSSSKPMVAVKR